MPIITEAGIWLTRVATLLPAISNLWDAIKPVSGTKDPRGELEASLQLVRAMQDLQAREEIGGP